MARIKVLQVSHSYDAPFLDVANFYSELFDPKKYEVTSLFLKGEPIDDPEIVVKGENIIYLNTPTKKMRGLKVGLVQQMTELIKKQKFEIVIAQRYKAIYLVSLAQFRTHTFKFFGVIHAYNVFQNLSRKILIKLLKNKIHLIGVSKAIRDDIRKNIPIKSCKGVYALANCIPIDELKKSHLTREDARSALNIPLDSYIFGTAGRLHPEKDHTTLIKAFAKIHNKTPNAMLYIMGDGRLKNELNQLIKSLKIQERVKLLGMIPNGPNYFKAFDTFILPSAVEPFGMVLIEAMAAEVPVISSRSGGAIEVIERENKLFDIGDIDACAKMMQNALLWSDGEKNTLLRENSKRLENLYSAEAFKKGFYSLGVVAPY